MSVETRPTSRGQCENCETRVRRKLASTQESDDHWDVTFFDAQEAGEVGKSAPRNVFCSRECAIEGLKQGVPKENTEKQRKRRDGLLDGDEQ